MKVSIIIPTYNRGTLIINTLASLELQALTDNEMEVIIVDDGSTDGSGKLIGEYLSKTERSSWRLLVHEVNKGRAAACNTGIRTAKAPLVLFTDDDCVVKPDWAEMHFKRHAESKQTVSVLGSVTFPSEWIKRSNFVRYSNSRYVGNRNIRYVGGKIDDLPPNYFGGLNVSVSKDQLLKIGLFDEKVGRGQDGELGYRLWKSGVKLVYDPRPLVIHHSPEMVSLQVWLSKFVKSYRFSVPLFNELHPDYVKQFGHWFLEPPAFGAESLKRVIVKLLVRAVCKRSLANVMQSFLEKTDKWPFFYNTWMFKYVITTACLRSVNQRQIAK